MQCKYCKNNLAESASYCGNCGSTITNENKNVFINTFLNVFKGIINPNAFVRNSKIFEIGKTGIILGLIILLTIGETLIFSNSAVGKLSSYFISGEMPILTSIIKLIITIAISALVIFAATAIKKEETSFIQILNFEIYSYLFISIFSFVAVAFNFTTLYLLASIIMLYGALVYTVIVVQGIKSIWRFNTRIAFLVYMLRIIATSLVSMLVMKML